jgi:hypothetical protein
MRTVSSLGALILTAEPATLSAVPPAVHAKAQELSDEEMDAVTAGTDFCQFSVTNGVCTPALFQLLDPQFALPGQQSVFPVAGTGGFLLSFQQIINPGSEALTQVVVAPLPPAETVTVSLRASVSSPDASRTQTAISTNSASTGGNGSPAFRGPVALSPATLLLRTAPGPHP